ncbi:MAG: hypothetical protein Q9212_002246 [Teloschistes hypoglaucus]
MWLFLSFPLLAVIAKAATIGNPSFLTANTVSIASKASSEQNFNITAVDPLNSSLYYHIPRTNIDLYLRSTGDRMPRQEINACLQSLGIYIVRQIILYGDGPATAKITLHGTVFLNFVPVAIQWKATGRVVDALETLVATENWTFATVVEIEEQYRGIIGYLTLTYRAPGSISNPSTINDSLLVHSPNGNISVPSNAVPNGTILVRPTSLHSQDISGSHVNLICTGYGRALDHDSSFAALAAAQFFVGGMVKQRGPLALVDRIKPFKIVDVEFELYPAVRLRWYDLLMALEGVVDFMEQYDTFAFTFEIRWQGVRSLGQGQLRPKT